jgi:hypothetical protein
MNKKNLNIFILLILFLVNCNNFSDKKFYFENIKNDTYFIEILNSQNDEFKKEFIQENSENHDHTGYWLNKFDKNNSKADSLFQIIEKIKLSKFGNLNFSELNFKELKKIKNIEITEKEKSSIYQEIVNYRNLINEIKPDTITLFTKDFIFNDQKIENSLNLISEKNDGLKFLAVLSKIEVYIKISQIELNQYLFGFIGSCSFRYNKLSNFYIPVSKTLFLGNDYNSKIIFGSDDTTRYSLIVIDKDTFKTNQGKYFFKERARKDTGIVNINAKFLMESPSNGEILEYPFTIEYEVIK